MTAEPDRVPVRPDPALMETDSAAYLEAVGLLDEADFPLADTALALAAEDVRRRPASAEGAMAAHDSGFQGDVLAGLPERLARHRRTLGSWRALLGDHVDGLRSPGLDTCIEALRAVMIDHADLSGDVENYEDLANASLIRVMERGKGLPVALGILWVDLARDRGWAMDGIDFPGHFLVRLDVGGRRAILDPFHSGQGLTAPALRVMLKSIMGPKAELRPEHYAPVGSRSMLLRLQNNIKQRRMERGDVTGALISVQLMNLIAPDHHGLWREQGLIHLRLGNLTDAVAALDRFLVVAPPGPDWARVDLVLRELRQRLQ